MTTNTTKAQDAKLTKIKEQITQLNESGATRAKIEGYLLFEHNYSVNEAKALVQEVLGKSARAGATLEPVVKYIRDNYGKVEKQELIKGMCEVTGGMPSSMNHMYNYIRFAQEYANQEVAASGIK